MKENVLLNYLNTLAKIIFPLITFPYAAHILLPEGIGLVNFQNSIINYISLACSIGIPLYAVREIARTRENINERNKNAIEIALLAIFLTIFGYLAVFIIGQLVPSIHANLKLFYILSLYIFFTAIGVEWFYTAIENFKYITIRGLLVKSILLIPLFLFVKTKNDILIYGLITVSFSVGNNILNFIHLRKFITFSSIQWNKLNIFRHIKPAFHVFILNIATSIYTVLNPVLLGFISNNREVGYFTAGIKLSNIIMIVVTSMATVLLPRVSNLVQTNQRKQFNELITKVYHYYMALAFPFTAGLLVLCAPLTLLICGKAFYPACYTTALTAPTVIFISITNIIGIQILYPYGKEDMVTLSTIVGAIANLILGLLLIPSYGAVGAAISTTSAELSVLIIQVKLGAKYIPFNLIDKNILVYITAALIMSIAVFATKLLFSNLILQIVASTLVGIITYAAFLYYKKEDILFMIINYINSKIKKQE